MTWLDKQIKNLEATNSKFSEEIRTIKNICPEVCNEFSETTPLKLIFLNYSLDMYTTIIKKHFTNVFYVDLFAGSGINKMKNSKDDLVGSPFIAFLNHKDKYTKFFFCENDSKLFDALEKRTIALSPKNVEFFDKDCNTELDSIIKQISGFNNKHAFFFIDPYSMEFNWKSMEKVLNLHSDIVFTFMSSQIARAYSAAMAKPSYSTKALDGFFGDKSWKSVRGAKNLVEIYKNNIKKIRPGAVMESVNIDNYYDLIFITNKTKGDNPWMDVIRTVKKEIEKNPKSAVKTALDKCKRGQMELGDF